MSRRGATAKFDRWAPYYDDSALQPLLYRAVHRLVLERCAQVATAPRRMLDVGCGTGRLLRSARSFFPRTSLVGVDVSGGMLSIAAAGAASARMSLVLGAAERLPFGDATFDVVTATLTYRHWTDQAAGVSEVGRVLAHGGVFGLAAILPSRSSRRQSPSKRRWANLPQPLAEALACAGLRTDRVEEVVCLGVIPEVTFVRARRTAAEPTDRL
jgi:ubiquinone/menaquinone biosynthesis C-methylase UbiE